MTKLALGVGPPRGQASTALIARPRQIGLTLLKHTPVLALLTGVPALAAVLEEQERLAAALVFPTLVLVALALWSRRMQPSDDLRRIEALVTLALIFVLSSVVSMPAFMVLGMYPLDAFFEGVSGITTTGLSMARGAEQWPIAGHLLRGWMQWCGGVVVAVAGIALLMDAGHAARILGEQSVGGTDYQASARGKARVILVGYITLTGIGIVGATALIPGWWEGAMVALAAISTGGFTPRDASLAEYGLPAQVFVMTLCVAGSLSLLFYALALERGPLEALRKGTVPVTLAIVVAGVAVHVLLHGATRGWTPEALIPGVLNHVSAQTTAGFSAAPVASAGPLMLLLVVAMMLGGDVGSTTGGIKTARAITLMAMIRLVFLRLRLPEQGVAHLRIGGRRAGAERVEFAAALVGIYVLSVLAFWLALMIGGHAPLPAVFDAVSALSGVGLSTGVIGPDLSGFLKVMAILAMLLGRLEFFAFIILFLPSTWITRR